MITIKVEGLIETKKYLKQFPKELPTIIAKTLTFTAERVQDDLKKEIQRRIDRPKPITLNSLKKSSATPRKLVAEVWFKDPAWTLSKNKANQHWMTPQVYGGKRPLKRFEAALQYAGIMPKGYRAVPGRGVKLDRYGNIPGGTIVRILSALRAFRQVGFVANRTARSSARNRRQPQFFATNGKGTGPNPLAAGVWQTMPNGGVIPILIFVKDVTYHKRLPFYETARASTGKNLNRIFNERVASAMKKYR